MLNPENESVGWLKYAIYTAGITIIACVVLAFLSLMLVYSSK